MAVQEPLDSVISFGESSTTTTKDLVKNCEDVAHPIATKKNRTFKNPRKAESMKFKHQRSVQLECQSDLKDVQDEVSKYPFEKMLKLTTKQRMKANKENSCLERLNGLSDPSEVLSNNRNRQSNKDVSISRENIHLSSTLLNATLDQLDDIMKNMSNIRISQWNNERSMNALKAIQRNLLIECERDSSRKRLFPSGQYSNISKDKKMDLRVSLLIEKLIVKKMLPEQTTIGPLESTLFNIDCYEVKQCKTLKGGKYFDTFRARDAALEGMLSGNLHSGILRVNSLNRQEAFLSLPHLKRDVIIMGSAQNRALDGDRVIVQLMKPASPTDQVPGLVVHILQRELPYIIVGRLQYSMPEYRHLNRGGEFLFLHPIDHRHPAVLVPYRSLFDVQLSPGNFEGRLLSVGIVQWPAISSLPIGIIVEDLGPIGNIETETRALLIEARISDDPYNEKALNSELPKATWEIPKKELMSRVDLRHLDVFTIDPATARDLDDAVSVEIDVKPHGKTLYHVGVHIADVSFFVHPSSVIDSMAAEKATSVYLVQRAIPMLPQLLSGHLCSLLPNEDRLTLSCFLTINENGEILNERFCRSVIRSCYKFHYEHVQQVIDGARLKDIWTINAQKGNDQLGKSNVSHDTRVDYSEHRIDGIEKKLHLLDRLARKLRQARFDAGALSIENVKLSFQLDDETYPTSCGQYIRRESHKLIEEFMLLANMAAAKLIYRAFPECALLRRHQDPLPVKLAVFQRLMDDNGIPMSTKSSGAIQKSLDALQNCGDSVLYTAIQHWATKPMQLARYVSSADLQFSDFFHYSLHVPLYTHFTSPIRRYADIVVHRLITEVLAKEGDVVSKEIYRIILKRDIKNAMLASLNSQRKMNVENNFLGSILNTSYVSVISERCNQRKYLAKKAQDASQYLYLCQYLSRRTEKNHETSGIVLYLSADRFIVLLVEYGLEIVIRSKDLKGVIMECKNDALFVYSNDESDSPAPINASLEMLNTKSNEDELEGERSGIEGDGVIEEIKHENLDKKGDGNSKSSVKIHIVDKHSTSLKGQLRRSLKAQLHYFDKLNITVKSNCSVTPHRLEIVDFKKIE